MQKTEFGGRNIVFVINQQNKFCHIFTIRITSYALYIRTLEMLYLRLTSSILQFLLNSRCSELLGFVYPADCTFLNGVMSVLNAVTLSDSFVMLTPSVPNTAERKVLPYPVSKEKIKAMYPQTDEVIFCEENFNINSVSHLKYKSVLHSYVSGASNTLYKHLKNEYFRYLNYCNETVHSLEPLHCQIQQLCIFSEVSFDKGSSVFVPKISLRSKKTDNLSEPFDISFSNFLIMLVSGSVKVSNLSELAHESLVMFFREQNVPFVLNLSNI